MDLKIRNYLEAFYEKSTAGRVRPGEKEELMIFLSGLLDAEMIDQLDYDRWNQNIHVLEMQGIEYLEFSIRAANCLRRAGITSCGELRERLLTKNIHENILHLKNAGEKTVFEIISKVMDAKLVTENELLESAWGISFSKKLHQWIRIKTYLQDN